MSIPDGMAKKNMSPSLTAWIFSAAINATNSPFLALPAEIRQRIYNFALGGHILHVGSRILGCRETGAGPTVDCSCPHNYKGSDRPVMQRQASGLKECYVESSGSTLICHEAHRQCFQNSPGQERFVIKLNLLQTCRQIYHEGMADHSHW